MGNKNSKRRKLEVQENPKTEIEEEEYSVSYEYFYETIEEEELKSEIQREELFRIRKPDKVEKQLCRSFDFSSRMIQSFSSLEVSIQPV